MKLSELNDAQLAFLCVATQTEHDSIRRSQFESFRNEGAEEMHTAEYCKAADELREALDEEAERRKLDFNQMYCGDEILKQNAAIEQAGLKRKKATK